MLIRSQDKKQLVNLDLGHISIDLQDTKRVLFCGVSFSDEMDYTCIGEYSTDGRAMKVLDIIQEASERVNVFQMPADSEVQP